MVQEYLGHAEAVAQVIESGQSVVVTRGIDRSFQEVLLFLPIVAFCLHDDMLCVGIGCKLGNVDD
jgi:hypothetical protein